MNADTFAVTVFDYETEVFSDQVRAVSSHNGVGPFDVLGLHSNFISQIDTQLTIHLPNGNTKSWDIQSGVLRCLETAVHVYIVPQGKDQ